MRGTRRVRAPLPPIFCNHLFFCDYCEKLQTVSIEVKLIINNAPLTYVYPNTVKYLTPNHLLPGRQLCYPDIKSTVVRNLTVLSSTTDKINRITNHFWNRRRPEYVPVDTQCRFNVYKTSIRRQRRRTDVL